MAEKRQRRTIGDELDEAKKKIEQLEADKARLQATVVEIKATNNLILGAIEAMKAKLSTALA